MNKVPILIIIIILLSGSLCGCIGYGKDDKAEPSPLYLEPDYYMTIKDGKIHKGYGTTLIEGDIPTAIPASDIQPKREIFIDTNVSNEDSIDLTGTKFKIIVPEDWTLVSQSFNKWAGVERYSLSLRIDTASASLFLGYDYDNDGFADIYDSDNNFHGIDCEEKNTKKVWSDGCKPGEYKIKIDAIDPEENRAYLEYLVRLA